MQRGWRKRNRQLEGRSVGQHRLDKSVSRKRANASVAVWLRKSTNNKSDTARHGASSMREAHENVFRIAPLEISVKMESSDNASE